MPKTRLFCTSALRSALFIGFALSFAPAYAQEVAEEEDSPATLESEAEIESGQDAQEGSADIVVTGSRIRQPNLDSALPITSLGGQEFFETGSVSVGDVINELPAVRSTYSQANSTRFVGTAGLNLLDLRGLGTVRTLTLVNGRRHVAGDILVNGSSVDTNTIPADLIDRVDVVTGGNSAIYGSDAIAGVVNFVLKRDFEGIQLRGQGGVSHYKDAGAYFASLTAGQNFGDGRGNIAFNGEYARQNDFFGAGRGFLNGGGGFVTVDTDPAGSPNGSDGFPDRLFFPNVQSVTFSNTGNLTLGGNSRLNCGTDGAGGFFNCAFIFRPDGTLVPINGTRIGIAPNGSFTNSTNGEAFTSGIQLQLQPNLERYNLNLIGHYTFSRAFELFAEAKYTRSDIYGTGSRGPSFIPSASFLGDVRLAPRLDNPFLSDQARSLITEQLTRNSATGTPPAASTRLNTFRIALLGLGSRFEDFERETMRGVIGARGTFNDDWSYEVSANYGEFKEQNFVGGVIDRQKFLFAIDAARNPATGQIQCRAQFDPNARGGFTGAGDFPNQARIDADIAACIPINPFGGQFTQAQADYLLENVNAVGKITQFVANGFVSGDSSDWFELPGGPVGFAAGAEYRRETNFYRQDEQGQLNYLFYNAIPTFTAPALEVKEVFGELRVPILRDTPFFHDLTARGAARYADYSGATGGVLAWNAGVEWAPVRDLRLRGNFSRAVRAPNLGELFTAVGQNFAPAPLDPCSLRNLGNGSPTRVANCRADGVPEDFDFIYNQSLLIRSGGNVNLKEETADSYTIGGVFQPSFIPGLSLSVDYFDITVDDVITAVSAQQIINSCYDLADLDNPFCAVFDRAGPGGGPNGEQPGRIIEGSLLQSSLNFASLTARGIDAELAYRRQLEGVGRLDLRLQYTHNFERRNFTDPTDPNRADVQLLELGNPRDEFILRTDLKSGPLSLGYKMRYIGKMLNTIAVGIGEYEDVFPVQGRPPRNADFASEQFTDEVFYHDVRLGYDVGREFNFYIGVENLLNTEPPLGLTGIGAGSGIFDNRGRYYYAGAVAKF
jgi:outer membrane receptor protein involved in Fe transport